MPNNNQTKLQELLRELRINANFRQVDLADKLEKPQSYVSKYESGEKVLDFLEVRDICSALNIKFSDFANQYEGKINEGE